MEKEKKGKKKIIKIVIAILISIAVIIGAFFLIKSILINVQNGKEESKIAQINSQELQEKIIKEIEKNEKINIRAEEFKTTIGTSKMVNSDMLDFNVSIFEADNNINETDEMVYAFYERDKAVDNGYSCICLPLFMIDSNDDGSLKRMIFLPSFNGGIGNEVKSTIENVLKSEYDVNMRQHYLYDAKLFHFTGNFYGEELKRLFLSKVYGADVWGTANYEIDEYIYFDAFGLNVNK